MRGRRAGPDIVPAAAAALINDSTATRLREPSACKQFALSLSLSLSLRFCVRGGEERSSGGELGRVREVLSLLSSPLSLSLSLSLSQTSLDLSISLSLSESI